MKQQARAITIGILRALSVVIGVILLFWFLYEISALILFLGIAFVLSLIGRPIVIFLKRRLKFSNNLASITTLLFILGALSAIIWVFVPIIVEQGKNISEIDFDQVKRDLNELNMQASDYLGVNKLNLVEAAKQTSYVREFDFDIIPSFIESFFGNVGAFIVGLFSVLFISFFLLRDETMLASAITAFSKPGDEDRFINVFTKIKELLSRYFIGLTVQIAILAFIYSVLLLFIGVKNAMAVALICAFLNIVPYLGPVIGWVLMLLVIVSNNLGADFSSELLPLLAYSTAGYAFAQLVDNLLSQPIIFSKSVKSHPLEIFLIILIGGFVFGIPGMILAVPTYTALKVFSKEFFAEYKIVKRLTRNL